MELTGRIACITRRGLLAVGTFTVLGATLASCSYAPEYAITLNDDGHAQVEWCFDTSVTVRVRPADVVLTAEGGSHASGSVAVDLETASAGRWSPAGVPAFDDDTVIEILDGPATAAPALTVRVGDLRQGSYWYDGGQHSLDEWLDRCDPDDGGFDSVLGLLIGGAVCFLIVVGVVVWGIISMLKPRNYEPL